MDTDEHRFCLSVVYYGQVNSVNLIFTGSVLACFFPKKYEPFAVGRSLILQEVVFLYRSLHTGGFPMQKILYTLFMFLLLQQTGFADVPINYYVSPGGVDANNTCTNSAVPCRSIKTALKQVTHTKSFINIARGAYTETGMEILPGQNVTFVGGWISDFSEQTCNPAGTTIIAGNKENRDELFWINNQDNGQPADLTIKCLSLKKLSSDYIKSAVDIYAGSGGESNLTMDHTRITGFPDYAIDTYAVGNGKISTVINYTTINHNGSKYDTMYIGASDGENTLHMDHVSIIQNGTAQNNRHILAINSFSSGTIKAFLRNTILAENQTGNASPFQVETQNTSTISLASINNTITDNFNSRWRGYGFSALAFNTSHLMLTFKNTILYGNHGSAQDKELYFQQEGNGSSLNFTADYCMLGSHSISGSVSYSSTNEVHGDPLLNSTYHLKKGSAAIDAGICGIYTLPPNSFYIPLAPLDDIDGDKRPSNDGKLFGCDIGADEFKTFSWPMFLPAIVHQRLNP